MVLYSYMRGMMNRNTKGLPTLKALINLSVSPVGH